ncbi:TPA: hypothetical protein P7B54_004779, partial [Escherichia coli]|nr:hypothetical protein [Escherichia coli]
NDIVANLMTAGSLLSFLQISNNLSEIKDAGEDAINEARYNLGISDSSGFVGRSLGAPKAFYANGTYTRSPLARYAKVTLTGGGGGRAGSQAGIAGAAPGSGGGGAYDLGFTGTAFTGGDGATGMAIVEEFA